MLLSEVTSCLQGKKQGLKLTGKDLVKAISKDSTTLPEQTLIQLENAITSIELSDSDRLTVLPGDVCRLLKLIELLVHGNHLAALPEDIGDLKRLRTLLTHDNQLTALPTSLGELQNLQTLNISQNLLTELPSSFTSLQDLTYLNASYNRFTTFPPGLTAITKLSTLILSHCQVAGLPHSIGALTSLTTLHLDSNAIPALPASLADLTRLKTVNLEDNPYTDKKICKVVKEGRIKNILTHLKKHGAKEPPRPPPGKQQGAQQQQAAQGGSSRGQLGGYPFLLLPPEEDVIVTVRPDVKAVRPHIACALIRGLSLTPASFQALLTLQTTLHQTLCDKRTMAAIGTHDASRITAPLTYTARAPADLSFVPLQRGQSPADAPADGGEAAAAAPSGSAGGAEAVRGDQLKSFFAADQTMLKYLSSIEGASKWAALMDDRGALLSLPPVINSEYSRMEASSTDILVEVTAPPESNMQLVKQVLLELLTQLAAIAAESEQQLQVAPVRIVSIDGHTRLLFPPRIV